MRTVGRRREGRDRAAPDRPSDSPCVERSIDGRLFVIVDGNRHAVSVARCFPWSRPMAFLSLRDREGKEVALVTDPLALEDASREALEDALADASFVFEVTGVIELAEEVELRTWRVSTGQGERRFQTRLDDWPRKLPDGGLLIRDVTGDLYRIGEVQDLDRRSRSLLWAFID